MKPMQLIEAPQIPVGKEWYYETKYDGFRCLLYWTEEGVQLWSRKEQLLNDQFPELIAFCANLQETIRPFLPIRLDGEIVHLQTAFKSDFSMVQKRGRMRQKIVIEQAKNKFPCQYVVFDILLYKGKDLTNDSLKVRKKRLKELFQQLQLPLSVSVQHTFPFQCIEVFQDAGQLWASVQLQHGEGVIAKKIMSHWQEGKRTQQWIKVKNWRTVTVIVTKYESVNGYFTGAVFKEEKLQDIVTFRHGLSQEEFETMQMLFADNGEKVNDTTWMLPPAICVNMQCIDFDGKHLREPRFHSFAFTTDPAECDWKQLQQQLYPMPPTVQLTHLSKPIWPKLAIKKIDYLLYLQMIAPYLLPFLKDRALTLLRFPHGVEGESFYQKNAPDYTPDFIQTYQEADHTYMICQDIETLLWLGNQLALEFHIPFQCIDQSTPTEIVFDLDPPSVEAFHLAVEAALQMKSIFDHFKLTSFVKTSGGKGLQVYIPLLKEKFTYQETRQFTKFICDFLCEQNPQHFTTERLKKNRGNKLYLDYVQHDKGKTIIAPYSTRGNEQALVATPLWWEEVTSSLHPATFSMQNVSERVKVYGDPFRSFRQVDHHQALLSILQQLQPFKS